MTIEQWESLQETFAVLTVDGWKFPSWFMDLKKMILKKDSDDTAI